ncbi:Protein FAR1-RELATED SEQUENCE 5 [Linum perenne]
MTTSDDDNMASQTKNTGDVDKEKCDKLFDKAIMEMEFASWEAAEVFYNAYAKQVGFSIWRRDVQKSRGGEIRMVKWVCGKEGFRDPKWLGMLERIRKPRAQTREGCRAMLKVNLDRTTGKWIVKDLNSSHTHSLVLPKHTQFLPSQREITEGDKRFIESMHCVGVSTRHIVELCKEQHGGFQKMGFTPKDVENAVQGMRRNMIQGGDANTTLAMYCLF